MARRPSDAARYRPGRCGCGAARRATPGSSDRRRDVRPAATRWPGYARMTATRPLSGARRTMPALAAAAWS